MAAHRTFRLAVLILLGALAAQAQYTVGRLEGTIFDPSGAVISAASVTLRDLSTNATRKFTTGDDGRFVFFALQPGPYELTAAAKTFAQRTRLAHVVSNQTAVHNLTLPAAERVETILIDDRRNVALPADAQQSMVRREEELQLLPNIARNMINLVSWAPGVQPTNNPRGGSTFGGGGNYVIILGVQSGLIAANGGRARATSVQLDYTDANDWEGGGFAPGMQAITPEVLEEFTLLTSNFPAEYGVKSNAQVMMVTRSGTNSLHGSAYDFLQNDAANARDYFDTSGRASKIKQNIYGFTLGGPLRRDRTFLFGGYEGRRTRGAAFTNIVRLPTEAARERATNPIILDLMQQYLPLPERETTPPNPDLGELTTQIPSPVDNYQLIARADHRFGDAQTLSVRYLQGAASFVARFPAQNLLPGFDVDNRFLLRNLNLNHTWTMGPRSVNLLRLAYGRAGAIGSPQNGLLTPRFQIVGLVNFGALETSPTSRIFNVYQVNDTFEHVRGTHALKFGADIRKIQDNSLSETNSRGVFTFPSLNAFLAAQPSSWTQLFGNTYRGFRTGLYGFFFQDDWKLRPTFTLNLGLRWDVQGALSEADGLTSVLDPAQAGEVGVAGAGPLGSFRIGGDAVESNPFNLAPRVGFAWNPRGGSLVVRGGYGVFWDSFTFAPLAASRFAPPFVYSITLSGAQISGSNSFDALYNGTATILAEARSRIGSFGDLVNFGAVTSVSPRLRNPYVQHFTLAVDWRAFGDWDLGLAYVGTKGTRLTRLVPINPVVRGPAPATSPADEQARLPEFRAAIAAQNGPGNARLDPRFDQVNLHDDGGSSIYHSLQVTARKHWGDGLQLQASYTWSKSLDDASDFVPTIQANDNSFPQQAFDLAAERAVSNYDIPHRIVFTGIWQAPFFRDFKGAGRKVLDGWSLEWTGMWQSGLPATLLAGPRAVPNPPGAAVSFTDVNLDGNIIRPGLDNTRADCSPAGTSFALGDPERTAGFGQPLLGHDGTCPRNPVRMRRLANIDLAVTKHFELAESGPLGSGPWRLQVRAEMFNAFNIPFLTAQGDGWRTASSTSFARVNAAGSARKMQFAMKLTW